MHLAFLTDAYDRLYIPIGRCESMAHKYGHLCIEVWRLHLLVMYYKKEEETFVAFWENFCQKQKTNK